MNEEKMMLEERLSTEGLAKEVMSHLTGKFLIPSVVDFWFSTVKDRELPLSATFFYQTDKSELSEGIDTTVYAEFEAGDEVTKVMLLRFGAHSDGIEVYREMHRVGMEACVEATIIRERAKGCLCSRYKRGCEDEADIFD